MAGKLDKEKETAKETEKEWPVRPKGSQENTVEAKERKDGRQPSVCSFG